MQTAHLAHGTSLHVSLRRSVETGYLYQESWRHQENMTNFRKAQTTDGMIEVLRDNQNLARFCFCNRFGSNIVVHLEPPFARLFISN